MWPEAVGQLVQRARSDVHADIASSFSATEGRVPDPMLAASYARRAAGPLLDGPARMLDRPSNDLERSRLGHAGHPRRLQERHMEFLAARWLDHQACENDEFDHFCNPLWHRGARRLRDHGAA